MTDAQKLEFLKKNKDSYIKKYGESNYKKRLASLQEDTENDEAIEFIKRINETYGNSIDSAYRLDYLKNNSKRYIQKYGKAAYKKRFSLLLADALEKANAKMALDEQLGISAKMRETSDWIASASSAYDRIQESLKNIADPAQRAREFDTYADYTKQEIDNLLKQAQEYYDFFAQNADALR